MKQRVRYFLVPWCVALVGVWAAVAGERAGWAEPVAGTRAEAKALFEKAEVHFSLGEFHKALPAYRRAYQLTSHPALLFNMAQCHRHLGQPEKAIFLLRRFLATGPAPDQRRQAETILERLKTAPATQAALASAPAANLNPGAAPLAPAPLAETPSATDRPAFYRRWWFWTVVGVVVVGSATALAVAAADSGDTPAGTLNPIDYR